MISMRPSRVLKKLRDGGVALSFKNNLSDPRVTDIAAMSGFDCVWICMEHIGLSWPAVEAQIYAAKSWDVDVLVRVPRGSYSDCIKPLELDAAGIMVPHVMSVEDARNVVRMTRFHPIGRRPVDGGNADGRYCNMPFTDYIRQANEQRFVIVQIEDPEPMDDLDAICAVEGIDMIFFGPGDFSHGIGAPAQMDHPRVVDARKRVAEAAIKHGRFAGTTGGLDNVEDLVKLGYRFVNIGADVLAISEYCKNIVSTFRKSPIAKISSVYGAG